MNRLRVLILCIICFAQLSFAEESKLKPLSGLSLSDLRLTPVQSGGRIKPFDEFARETILSITGMRTFGEFDPSEMMLSLMVSPQEWAKEPIIRISNGDVNKQLLLDPAKKYFSPSELMANNAFLQYAEGVQSRGESSNQVTSTGVNPVTGQKDPRGEELKRVVDRVSRFQALVTGKLWNITPPKDQNINTAWAPLAQGMNEPSPQSQAAYMVLKSYLEKNTESFATNAVALRKSVEEATPQFESIKTKLQAENIYNRLRPFLFAMIFYLLAGILWLFAKAHGVPKVLAAISTIAAAGFHTFGFALRCYIAGRPPVTNMYESIIWVSLGVMVFGSLIYIKNRQIVLMSVATILAGISLFAADSAPLVMDPTIRPLVPVLRSNYWLTIHVLTITISYGAFMLAMGISNVTLFQFRKKAIKGESIEISQRIALLNQLSYRALMFGTVLLAAGTILGGVWADYSWGRFWGWDPKEVWALIALLAYMAVIHGRYAGLVGTFAFPLWTVICFSTVVMAWYGVNFVLGVGLHSYGFSSGGQAMVTGFISLQTLFCCWIAWIHHKGKEQKVTHA